MSLGSLPFSKGKKGEGVDLGEKGGGEEKLGDEEGGKLGETVIRL